MISSLTEIPKYSFSASVIALWAVYCLPLGQKAPAFILRFTSQKPCVWNTFSKNSWLTFPSCCVFHKKKVVVHPAVSLSHSASSCVVARASGALLTKCWPFIEPIQLTDAAKKGANAHCPQTNKRFNFWFSMLNCLVRGSDKLQLVPVKTEARNMVEWKEGVGR